jgi:hypothetical protein
MWMEKRPNPKDQRSEKSDTASKLAAHKTADELNPHHQKAKPKAKK